MDKQSKSNYPLLEYLLHNMPELALELRKFLGKDSINPQAKYIVQDESIGNPSCNVDYWRDLLAEVKKDPNYNPLGKEKEPEYIPKTLHVYQKSLVPWFLENVKVDNRGYGVPIGGLNQGIELPKDWHECLIGTGGALKHGDRLVVHLVDYGKSTQQRMDLDKVYDVVRYDDFYLELRSEGK